MVFMRHFIRHPSDIPIEFQVDTICAYNRECLNDVGHGGLCFSSVESIEPGTQISIRIVVVKPPFEAVAQVVWCRQRQDHYDVGIAFNESGKEFLLRMVEQVCYIESYKQRMLTEEGRVLTGEEAAQEWIAKYASHFPR